MASVPEYPVGGRGITVVEISRIFTRAERLKDELGKAGLKVRWVPFDGGHGIAPAVLSAIGELIAVAGA